MPTYTYGIYIQCSHFFSTHPVMLIAVRQRMCTYVVSVCISLSLYIYIYIQYQAAHSCMSVCRRVQILTCFCVHVCLYPLCLCLSLSLSLYIYMYIFTHRHTDRQPSRQAGRQAGRQGVPAKRQCSFVHEKPLSQS